MFKIHRQEMEWAGHRFALETGKIAKQALGAVMVEYGDTRVLCTVAASSEPSSSSGFLPLSVHYQEKYFAAGKIPGGFLKRESKPSDREVLSSRLIDRALRPMFESDFANEIQIICAVLSYDAEADPIIAGLIGASAALVLSGIPTKGIIAGLRLGYDGKTFIVNPTKNEGLELDLILAGTKEGIIMVESQASEKSEEFMIEALFQGHTAIQPLISLIENLALQVNPKPFSYTRCNKSEDTLWNIINDENWDGVLQTTDRKMRAQKSHELKVAVREKTAGQYESAIFSSVFNDVWKHRARNFILSEKKRLDGRKYDEVRQITCEVGLLPRAHGSALFTRGDTQALVSVTLGGKEDSQLVDDLTGTYRDTFFLHYNFPSFSVGETGRVGPPGRREVGHGKLAWRALQAVIPKSNPYTVRIVSDITESYGSSSMATICGSSLALMDAGVAIEKPIAGIAMGMVCENDKIAFLSDISGSEDHLGDMDFKVAGTAAGITALQMDLKGGPLSHELMGQALQQALRGRLHILEAMQSQTISESRTKLSSHAPLLEIIKIPTDKIRDLIGPGGKVIREICDSTGSKIDITDDGTVSVFSQNKESSDITIARIKQLTGSPTVGDIYQGAVVKLTEFGAFVNFGFTQDGLVHISEISTRKIDDIATALTVGDKVRVKLIGLDARNRSRLSIRQAIEE